MKFFHSGLIVSSLVSLVAAAGYGPPPKHPNRRLPAHHPKHKPPHRPLPPHHPKRKPSHRYLKGKKGGGKASTARIDCNDANPLTLLDTGCPCFDQARIDSLSDFSAADYCYFDQYSYTDDVEDYSYEDTWLSGYGPEQKTQDDPPIFETSGVDFYLTKYNDPDYEYSSCDVAIDTSKIPFSYQDYDDEDYDPEMENGPGEYHVYYLSATLTDGEYKACKDILDAQKGMLPDNCEIYSDSD